MSLVVGQSFDLPRGNFKLWGCEPELLGGRISSGRIIDPIFEGRFGDESDGLFLFAVICAIETQSLGLIELALVVSPEDLVEYEKYESQ